MGRQKSGRFKLHLRNFNRNARKKIKAGNQHRDCTGCTGCNSRGGQREGQLPLRAKPGSLEEGIHLQRDAPPSHPVLKAALWFFFSSKAQAAAQAAAPASCRHLHPLSGICSQTQRCRSLTHSPQPGFYLRPRPYTELPVQSNPIRGSWKCPRTERGTAATPTELRVVPVLLPPCLGQPRAVLRPGSHCLSPGGSSVLFGYARESQWPLILKRKAEKCKPR